MNKSQIDQWAEGLPAAAREWLNGRRVEEVECVISDFAGIARGKVMPARKFIETTRSFLPVSIFYQTITGEYSDYDTEESWTERDMVLVPDLHTAVASPWADDVTVQIIHDMETLDGDPVPLSPRYVLKRVLNLYKRKGWEPVVAPELEFYLTKPNIDPDFPLEPPVGRSGRQGAGRQSYSIAAIDEYTAVIDTIYDFAEAQGIEIDTIIQEGGAGQIEINLNHGNPLLLADQVFFFKRTVREAALRHNCYATFMAKPIEDEPGSAMHIHQSVVDRKTGTNIFSKPDGSPSDLFHWFIGGQQHYLISVISLLAPYVNSYRRLVPGVSAPINLEWGCDNRSTGLRIPTSGPEARRVENRVVGMDTNPYLALAACLACGYLGMTRKVAPREAVSGDAYSLPHALPAKCSKALNSSTATRKCARCWVRSSA
ncbi:glutamine synthetase family protein [Salaquimonas pukyongi]|uniref:glutamine synthetase family protein n=1 Tax=Salaquimonas pukyongi TaxID=2712698 RepID=UPI001FCCF10A|nr:glutamine synthetase family protein [Salaquimonas pukyongi]